MAVRQRVTPRAVTFRRIYQRNSWNGKGTRAGPGSSERATADLQRALPSLMEELNVQSVLDAGCNDSAWMPDLPGYVGLDIVTFAVAAAQKRHPERDYRVADICVDDLPRTDLVLCRDTLQHLSFADGLAAIANFKRSGAQWLLSTSHRYRRNVDVPSGHWYAINLQDAPFSLGPPEQSIRDGSWDHGVKYPTKYLGLWRL